MKVGRALRAGALVGLVLSGLVLIAPLTGCAAAAYGLGVATMVNDMKVRQRGEYESYRRQAEAEKAPRIMSFRQWAGTRHSG